MMIRNRWPVRAAGALVLVLAMTLLIAPAAGAAPPVRETVTIDFGASATVVTTPELTCGYSGVFIATYQGELQRITHENKRGARVRYMGRLTGEISFQTNEGKLFAGEYDTRVNVREAKPGFTFRAVVTAEDGTRIRLRISGRYAESAPGEPVFTIEQVECQGPPPALPCPDADLEPNNSPEQATTYPPAARHAFCTPNDEDWVAFEANGGTEYEAYVAGLPPGTRITLELYDSDGTTLIETADDKIIWLASETKTYYVRARHADGASSGAFTYVIGIGRIFSAQNSVSDASILLAVDTPDPVVAGDYLAYTVVGMNHGPESITGWEIRQRLPEGVEFVSATSSKGGCSFSETSRAVTCNGMETYPIFLMPVGEYIVTTIVVKAPPTPGTLSTDASISIVVPIRESNYANNTATLETTVIGP